MWHSFGMLRDSIGFSDTALPTDIHSWGWESLCEIRGSCLALIIQEFYFNMQGFNISIAQFVTQVQGIRIVVTPQLIFDALHVPRVDFPDYPNCPRLQTVSKNKHSSLFYETPSSQSDHQNTPRSSFAKFLRFLNMVMTFVLHPLSHYNSITIDFPSHFILSFIDVYRDMATRDKLIFPYAIRRIIRHSSVPYLESAHFTIMGAISAASVRRSEAQLRPKQP